MQFSSFRNQVIRIALPTAGDRNIISVVLALLNDRGYYWASGSDLNFTGGWDLIFRQGHVEILPKLKSIPDNVRCIAERDLRFYQVLTSVLMKAWGRWISTDQQ